MNRMKQVTISKLTSLLLVTLILVSGVSFGGQVLADPGPETGGQVLAHPEPETGQGECVGSKLESLVRLARTDPILEKLHGSEAVRQLNAAKKNGLGTLVWEEASLATYHGTDIKAVVIPIDSRSSHEKRALIAYFTDKSEGYHSLVLGIAPAAKMRASIEGRGSPGLSPFSGTISFYTSNGELISAATYDEDQLVSITEGNFAQGRAPGLQAPLAGEDWECFKWCIANAWPYYPWWLQVYCGAAFGGCVWGGNIFACAALVGCLAGYGAACFSGCWF